MIVLAKGVHIERNMGPMFKRWAGHGNCILFRFAKPAIWARRIENSMYEMRTWNPSISPVAITDLFCWNLCHRACFYILGRRTSPLL